MVAKKDKGGSRPTHAIAAAQPAALFAALDGRQVSVSGRKVRLEVYGVWDDLGRRWVQLGLHGRPLRVLTLRLAAGAGVISTLEALQWLAAANPELMEVVGRLT
jgi:hypothetical protein